MCWRVVLSVWLFWGVWGGQAFGQPQAMPANTVLEPEETLESVAEGPILAQSETAPDELLECEPLEFESLGDRAPAFGSAASYYTWQLLPDGLMYKAYLAGGRESRFASQWVYREDHGWLWDTAVGGHVGLLRFGTDDPAGPVGWQFDAEAAAFPRLDLEHSRDLVATDYRFGLWLTGRQRWWETKLGYYHLSSHIGDEFMLANPLHVRNNYVRDTIVLAAAWRPYQDLRCYVEAGYAVYTGGGSKPWEFQFGVDLSPPAPTGTFGAPFFAVNGRIRQEVDYGGSLTVQTGWSWRGETGHRFRVGFHYFNGKSDQYQFFDEHEELIGLGVWYDF